jgi:hypothetical protein
MAKKRKSVEKVATAEQIKKQLERIQAEAEQELLAEKRLLEEVEASINEICEREDLYCGIILTPQDVMQIVDLAMQSKENIKIPFRLYYKE